MEVERLLAAHILVVDDDPATDGLYVSLLTSEDYRVTSAGDGTEALQCVRRDMPNLILIDVSMASDDGLDLCRVFRAKPATCDLPILLVTNLDDDEARMRAREVADDILVKPLDTTELFLRVSSLLRTRARVLRMRTLVDRLTSELERANKRIAVLERSLGSYRSDGLVCDDDITRSSRIESRQPQSQRPGELVPRNDRVRVLAATILDAAQRMRTREQG